MRDNGSFDINACWRFLQKCEDGYMDRVTRSYLEEFSENREVLDLPEDKRFEHFCGYIITRRHISSAFDTRDIVTGCGNDAGIDAIAIKVNGALITDIDTLEEHAKAGGTFDVTFIFLQAERSSSFDGAKISSFVFGVMDFFKDKPALKQNDQVKSFAEIMAKLYNSRKLKPGNPVCELYYVTTGKWQKDQNLEAKKTAAIADLENTNLFRKVSFECLGALEVQKLYTRTKNSIVRDFVFEKREEVPPIAGVTEAYIGFIPAKEFLPIITDDDGNINGRLFVENVRDFLGDSNPVNEKIAETLKSKDKDKFVLMNNGITVIANSIQRHAAQFTLEEFYIVNGCQTSNVLFNTKDILDASVMVPFRLIVTKNEHVINSIITGTNSQSEVKSFLALNEFAKNFERFFQSFESDRRLYYERRPGQYDRANITQARVITPQDVIRSFAAMFLNEPHTTTRNYKSIHSKIGTEIFVPEHKPDPYYLASLAFYKVDNAFRWLPSRLKPARFHFLLAIRLLAGPGKLPWMNSKEMENYCHRISELLWDQGRTNEIITTASLIIEAVAGGNFHRDNIRAQPFTERMIEECAARL